MIFLVYLFFRRKFMCSLSLLFVFFFAIFFILSFYSFSSILNFWMFIWHGFIIMPFFSEENWCISYLCFVADLFWVFFFFFKYFNVLILLTLVSICFVCLWLSQISVATKWIGCCLWCSQQTMSNCKTAGITRIINPLAD